jgi:PST family polysaccharide transporter
MTPSQRPIPPGGSTGRQETAALDDTVVMAPVDIADPVVAGADAVPGDGHATASQAGAGAGITIVAMFVRQFGRLGFAVLLARLLGPTDFGVAAAATVYISFTAVLLETGFGAVVVQKANLRPPDEGAVFWVNAIVGAVTGLLTAVASAPIANFLDVPDLQPVLVILAIGPVAKGLAVVPLARLQRTLRFKALAVLEMVAIVAGAVLGIGAAWLGAGYWALVVQQLATDLLVLLLMTLAAGLPHVVVDRAGMRHLRTFGLPLLGAQVIGYANRNVDNVIISRFLGQTALSFYSVPYRIMMVPVSMLGNVANRLAFPVIARLQGKPEEMRDFFLRITQLIAVIVVPSMLVVSVLAPQFVAVVFGPKWLAAVPVLQVLAVTGALQAITTAGGSVLMGTGRSDLSLRWALIPLVICVSAFVIGLRWGVFGVAAAYSVATVLITPFLVRAVGSQAGFGFLAWLRAITPPVLAALPAGAAAWAFWPLTNRLGAFPVLAGGMLAAGLVYVVTLRVFAPAVFQSSMRAGRMLLRGRTGGAT